MPGLDPGILFVAAKKDAKVKPWHDEKWGMRLPSSHPLNRNHFRYI
jgi:hypothetical protein